MHLQDLEVSTTASSTVQSGKLWFQLLLKTIHVF